MRRGLPTPPSEHAVAAHRTVEDDCNTKSMNTASTHRLDRPVDSEQDHILGPPEGTLTLLEYGSYDCAHCRAANRVIARTRDRFGEQMRYVFRQTCSTSSAARRASSLFEIGR